MLYRIKILKGEHKYVITDEDGNSQTVDDSGFLHFIANADDDDRYVIDEGMIPS